MAGVDQRHVEWHWVLSKRRERWPRLVAELHDYRTLHVAGSNGKGTLCAVLSAALSHEDIPNLMFSSPHLIDVEERRQIERRTGEFRTI